MIQAEGTVCRERRRKRIAWCYVLEAVEEVPYSRTPEVKVEFGQFQKGHWGAVGAFKLQRDMGGLMLYKESHEGSQLGKGRRQEGLGAGAGAGRSQLVR